MEQKIYDLFESETMPQECASRIEDALRRENASRRIPRCLTAAAAVLALVMVLGSVPAIRVGALELYEQIIHTITPELANRYGEVAEDHVVLFGGFHATSGDATGNDLEVFIYQEEEIDMSKDELRALIREIVKEVLEEENPVYKDLKDVPSYWQGAAAALLDAGVVNGGTSAEVCDTDLNLRKETLKAAVVAVMYHEAKEKGL